MRKIAILGAGIAGLSCLNFLDKSNFSVTIFERKSVPGGRVASHQTEQYTFDYGAQYINETNSRFQDVLTTWEKEGIISSWDSKVGELSSAGFKEKFVKSKIYVGTPTMDKIPKYILGKNKEAEVKYDNKIVGIIKESDQWKIKNEYNEIFGPFDFIVLTFISEDLQQETDDLFSTNLGKIQITPRIALMIGFESRLPVDVDAMFVENSSIRWMAREKSKPERNSNECWTIHGNKNWSQKNLDSTPSNITKRLSHEFARLHNLNYIEPKYSKIKIWKQGIVEKPLGVEYVFNKKDKIGIAGDFCLGNNIESAYLSGKSLASKLNKLVT